MWVTVVWLKVNDFLKRIKLSWRDYYYNATWIWFKDHILDPIQEIARKSGFYTYTLLIWQMELRAEDKSCDGPLNIMWDEVTHHILWVIWTLLLLLLPKILVYVDKTSITTMVQKILE